LLRQDIAFFQQTTSSDLVTRIAMNAQAASTGLNLIATSIGRDLLTVLSLVAVMASQDWLLTLIALIGVPLVFVGLGRLLKMVRKLFSSEMLSIASIIATLQETSHAIRIIRSFRLDDAMQERMNASVQAVERLSNCMVAAQAATNPLLDSLCRHCGGVDRSLWRLAGDLLQCDARRLFRLHHRAAAADGAGPAAGASAFVAWRPRRSAR
jgi:ATP-binding cassette subfamily B protein